MDRVFKFFSLSFQLQESRHLVSANLKNSRQESIVYFLCPGTAMRRIMTDDGVVRALRLHLESTHYTIYILISFPKNPLLFVWHHKHSPISFASR